MYAILYENVNGLLNDSLLIAIYFLAFKLDF